jgi:hypothetical protein
MLFCKSADLLLVLEPEGLSKRTCQLFRVFSDLKKEALFKSACKRFGY